MSLEVGDVIRVAMTGESPGANVFQNVWHYRMAVGAGGDEDLFLAAVEAKWRLAFAEITTRIASSFLYSFMEAWKRDTVNQRWDGIAALDISDTPGTNVGDPLPHGAAALNRHITTVFRRQGRHFIPGMAEAETALGLFASAALSDMADYGAIFDDTVIEGGNQYDWGVYNVDAASVLFQTFAQASNTVIANGIVAYQRRRKPLVGI